MLSPNAPYAPAAHIDITDMPVGSPEWNAKRKTYLGGSDAAAILGVSPYATPVELWLEKTGQAAPKPFDPVRERIFARGKKLEPVVLDMVLDKLREQGHDVELLATNKRYTDPDYPFLSCEIDFELMLDGEHINGDCKTVTGFARRKWGEEDSEEVPIEYAAQFMHGLGITRRRKTLVAALIGLDDVAIYWTIADDETIEAMREKSITFWNDHVLAGVAPDTFTFDDVKLLFPVDNGLSIAASPEIAQKVVELEGIKYKIKTLEEREELLKHEIADFINPFSVLLFDGKEICSWKGQNDTRLDMEKFKDEQPELFNQYKRTKVIRVLRIKKAKK
jgi:putative phage-type endonuclease